MVRQRTRSKSVKRSSGKKSNVTIGGPKEIFLDRIRAKLSTPIIVGVIVVLSCIVLSEGFIYSLSWHKTAQVETRPTPFGPGLKKVEASPSPQLAKAPQSDQPWFDPTQPDNMKVSFWGDSYIVTPDKWTVIPTQSPIQSARFFYGVRFIGAPPYYYMLDGKDDGQLHMWPSPNPGDGMLGNCDKLWMKSRQGIATVRILWVRTKQADMLVHKK